MAKVRRIDDRVLYETWQQALDDFILFKQGQGLSKTTIDDYQQHINRFFKRYPNAWPKLSSNNVSACTETSSILDSSLKPSVLDYLSQPVSPATFNLRREYLKVFFSWLITEAVISDNPLNGIKKRYDEGKIRQVDKNTLTKLLNLPNQQTFAGLRDYCLLLLTLDTGIRPGEAIQLSIEDIDLASNTITVRAGVSKTRRVRHLPISQVAAKAIRKLINARHPAWNTNTPVFCSYEGKPLKRNGWYQRLALYSKKLGVKVNPYSLRHTFAVMYLKAGGNAFSLQHTLGHSDMQMTKRYVYLTNQDLADVHRVASPLNSLIDRGSRVRKL